MKGLCVASAASCTNCVLATFKLLQRVILKILMKIKKVANNSLYYNSKGHVIVENNSLYWE